MSKVIFSESNCYYSCLINAAAFLGIEYKEAFSNLWSEINFTYNQKHNIYTTKQMIKNFETLGAKLEFLNCSSPNDSELSITSMEVNNWIIIGMDAFYIPWTPYYHTLHSLHYFLMQKISEKSFFFLDPTYDKENIKINLEDIFINAFEICYLKKIQKNPLNSDLLDEAKTIICTHSRTIDEIISKINNCKDKNRENASLLVKYIDALISNRHLYKYYIENSSFSLPNSKQIFDNKLIFEWQSIKNGLHKASLIKENTTVLEDVKKQLKIIINKEIDIAKILLSDLEN